VNASGFGLGEKTFDLPRRARVHLDVTLSVATEKQEVTVSDSQKVELDPAQNAGALVLKEEDLDMLSDDPDDLQADLLALAGPSVGPNGRTDLRRRIFQRSASSQGIHSRDPHQLQSVFGGV